MADIVNPQITDAVAAAVNPQITDAVNPQVTDAVTDTVNPQITDATARATPSGGDPPSFIGEFYAKLASATAMALQNAVYAQQQANVTLTATTTAGVETIYALDVAAGAVRPEAVDADRVKEAIERLREARTTPSAASLEPTGAAAPAAGADAPDSAHAGPAHRIHHAIEEAAAALQALNDLAMRQAIRQVEVAAVATTLARTLAVDPAAPNAAEQVRMYNELLRETIATMNGWAASL